MSGRFWCGAAPYVDLGVNVIPANAAGEPLVSLLDPQTGERFDVPNAPRVSAALYREWRARFPEAHAMLLPGSVKCVAIIVDDPSALPGVLEALEKAASSFLGIEEGERALIWVEGVIAPTETLSAGVMMIGHGGGVLAPMSAEDLPN